MMMFVKKWRDHLGDAVTEQWARAADRLSPSPFIVLPDSSTALRPYSGVQFMGVKLRQRAPGLISPIGSRCRRTTSDAI
jgi:hypothetical protein